LISATFQPVTLEQVFSAPGLEKFLVTFKQMGINLGLEGLHYVATLSDRSFLGLLEVMGLEKLWIPPEFEEMPEVEPASAKDSQQKDTAKVSKTNEMMQKEASQLRDEVNGALQRFRSVWMLHQNRDVCCEYCGHTPNMETLQALDTVAKQRLWCEVHAGPAHFSCRPCELIENAAAKTVPGYKRKPVPKFPTLEAHFAHVEEKHARKLPLK
jgi:hypothetical protein